MAREPSKKMKTSRKPTKTATAQPLKTPVAKPPFATVFEARCFYDECDLAEILSSDVPVRTVQIREHEIVFEWVSDQNKAVQYTQLTTSDGIRYAGYTVWARGHGTDRARIEATLYSNSLGHILVGEGVWEQEGLRVCFIIQLSGGKQIADE